MCDAFDRFPNDELFAPNDQLIADIASPEDWYNRSYRILWKQAANLPDGPDGFLFLAHAAYGWMPTMLKKCRLDFLPDCGATVFADLRNCRTPERAAGYLNKMGGPPINNSWVGTSKVLHFINPDIFPIWDLRVARHFGLSYAATLQVTERYSAYLQYLHVIAPANEASVGLLRQRFEEGLGYAPSAIRCLELMLFHSEPPGND